MSADDHRPLLCPSARCAEGARLLGIVGGDGVVSFTSEDIRIDSGFVERAAQGRTPETRFRFAAPCRRGGCRQWADHRCGVVDAVVEEVATSSTPLPTVAPPACSIRPQCRWFAQSGHAACRACPLVVTE